MVQLVQDIYTMNQDLNLTSLPNINHKESKSSIFIPISLDRKFNEEYPFSQSPSKTSLLANRLLSLSAYALQLLLSLKFSKQPPELCVQIKTSHSSKLKLVQALHYFLKDYRSFGREYSNFPSTKKFLFIFSIPISHLHFRCEPLV